MTPEEAAKLGLSEDERRLHVRISNGKANAGPLGKAKWMKLVVVNLINGDAVAAASPWSPPDPFKNVTTADMELARTLAATGGYRLNSGSPKWFGYALAKHFDLKVSHAGDTDPADLARVQSIMKTWLNNKVLEIEERKDDEHKIRSFIIPGSFKPTPPAHRQQNIPMKSNQTLTTGGQLAGQSASRSGVFRQSASSASPMKGQRDCLAERTPPRDPGKPAEAKPMP